MGMATDGADASSDDLLVQIQEVKRFPIADRLMAFEQIGLKIRANISSFEMDAMKKLGDMFSEAFKELRTKPRWACAVSIAIIREVDKRNTAVHMRGRTDLPYSEFTPHDMSPAAIARKMADIDSAGTPGRPRHIAD